MGAAQVLGLGDEIQKLKKHAQDAINNPGALIQQGKNIITDGLNGKLTIENLKKNLTD